MSYSYFHPGIALCVFNFKAFAVRFAQKLHVSLWPRAGHQGMLCCSDCTNKLRGAAHFLVAADSFCIFHLLYIDIGIVFACDIAITIVCIFAFVFSLTIDIRFDLTFTITALIFLL